MVTNHVSKSWDDPPKWVVKGATRQGPLPRAQVPKFIVVTFEEPNLCYEPWSKNPFPIIGCESLDPLKMRRLEYTVYMLN